MKKRGLAVRVIAIVLCALMVLSVFAIGLTKVFACDDESYYTVQSGGAEYPGPDAD